MSISYKKVSNNNKSYIIGDVEYRDAHVPFIIDYKDYQIIKSLNKNWKCNQNGFISCFHNIDNNVKEVYLHDVIMALQNKEYGIKSENKPILHINRIGLDNRRENLIYDTVNKETNKNLKKKKRIIELPRESGIDADEIPTYIWYLKPDQTHGDRFIVEVGDISWKTTSSKKLSLRYKLEEAKKFLRNLKSDRKELFDEYSMNGEYTKDGKKLLNSFYSIIYKGGYNHIHKISTDNLTDIYLKPHINKLENKEEKNLLKAQNLVVNEDRRRRLFNNLPKDSGITVGDLPKYCYFRPKNDNRGDYFVVENHPKNMKTWRTTSSNDVSIKDKYNELLDYINDL